ncbi:hypothetical protein [Hymenobacter crusticola]|uniref:hypothetical protein n=1 Tax=Hymenobacter crusticola TaxID=1770526 RepID=UPI0015C503AB|nr:hypothetical protein [Hymenobacter crusticola]
MKQRSPDTPLRGKSIIAALTPLGYFPFAAATHREVLPQKTASSYDPARVLTSA